MTSPAKTKAIAAPIQEIGYQQAIGYNWWLYENETTPELVWPQSIYVFDQMRRTDSQCTSILKAVTLPVMRTPWRISPNGAKDEVVEFVANDLGLPIVGQKVPKQPPRSRDRFSWQDHLREALLMLPFGFAYFEQVYRPSSDAKEMHLRKLAYRPAKTIEYINVAEDGGLESVKQYWVRTDAQPAIIPVDHLVAYINEREGGNWLGKSIFRSSYKNWLLKDRILRVWAQTIERNGMGIPQYTGPEGATDNSAGLAMAKALRAGESAGSALPFGATLKLIGVEGTLPDAEPAVRYHDEAISKSVLAHFLNLGGAAGTGSWALGTTFADFFTMSLQTLAQQIADTATQHIIEDLVDINFGEDEPAPILTFDEIGRMQPATADALRSLTMAGVIHPDEVLEESTRQQYGLPPKDPNAPKVPPPLPSMVRENLTGQAPGALPLHPGEAPAAAPAPDLGGGDATAAVAAMRSVAASAADEIRGLLEEVRAAAGVARADPADDDLPASGDPADPVAAAALRPGQRYRHGWIPIAVGESTGEHTAKSAKAAARGMKLRRSPGGAPVRDSLKKAKTTHEVGVALADEAKRLTGRDMHVDFEGSDVQIAREHAEGILQGLERYPNTRVSEVRMGDDIIGGDGEAIAATRPDGANGHIIIFSHDAQRYGATSYRADMRNEHREGFRATGTPTGVALHEFGHAVANQYSLNGWTNNKADESASLDFHTEDAGAAVSKHLSRYAATSQRELSAEAFSDVLTNGDSASLISRTIMKKFDQEITWADIPDEEGA